MPEGHPNTADIDAVLSWTAIRAGRRLERMVAERLDEHGLTPVQFGMLAQLAARPGLNQSELARAVQVRPQSARETVHALIDRGLLRMTAPGGRGRRAGVVLTADGRAALTRAWPLVAGIDAAALGLRPGQDATLNGMLHTVLGAG